MEKYQAVHLIGQGSYGKAVLVRRKNDNKQCIIKQINLSSMSKKEQSISHQEAVVLSKLKHSNIVGYLENFVVKIHGASTLCIVMEYADGGDLETFLKKRNGRLLDENKVIDWFVQISLAVKHIHDRKILHRDLKSGNIFLTSKGIIKVGDFGIAKVLSSTMEQARTAIGTPYYMSPEIMQEKRYNHKSDIWSLGCILYEMLALKHAFEAVNMRALMQRIVRGIFSPLPSFFSKEIRDLNAEMLSVDARRRPRIDDVLTKPVIQRRISSFLSETMVRREFSHTVLHGENIFEKGHSNVQAPRVPMPVPIAVPNPFVAKLPIPRPTIPKPALPARIDKPDPQLREHGQERLVRVAGRACRDPVVREVRPTKAIREPVPLEVLRREPRSKPNVSPRNTPAEGLRQPRPAMRDLKARDLRQPKLDKKKVQKDTRMAAKVVKQSPLCLGKKPAGIVGKAMKLPNPSTPAGKAPKSVHSVVGRASPTSDQIKRSVSEPDIQQNVPTRPEAWVVKTPDHRVVRQNNSQPSEYVTPKPNNVDHKRIPAADLGDDSSVSSFNSSSSISITPVATPKLAQDTPKPVVPKASVDWLAKLQLNMEHVKGQVEKMQKKKDSTPIVEAEAESKETPAKDAQPAQPSKPITNENPQTKAVATPRSARNDRVGEINKMLDEQRKLWDEMLSQGRKNIRCAPLAAPSDDSPADARTEAPLKVSAATPTHAEQFSDRDSSIDTADRREARRKSFGKFRKSQRINREIENKDVGIQAANPDEVGSTLRRAVKERTFPNSRSTAPKSKPKPHIPQPHVQSPPQPQLSKQDEGDLMFGKAARKREEREKQREEMKREIARKKREATMRKDAGENDVVVIVAPVHPLILLDSETTPNPEITEDALNTTANDDERPDLQSRPSSTLPVMQELQCVSQMASPGENGSRCGGKSLAHDIQDNDGKVTNTKAESEMDLAPLPTDEIIGRLLQNESENPLADCGDEDEDDVQIFYVEGFDEDREPSNSFVSVFDFDESSGEQFEDMLEQLQQVLHMTPNEDEGDDESSEVHDLSVADDSRTTIEPAETPLIEPEEFDYDAWESEAQPTPNLVEELKPDPDPISDSIISPPLLDLPSEGSHSDMSIDSPLHVLGTTLRLPAGTSSTAALRSAFGSEESIAFRLEIIREYLEEKMGLDSFVKAYRFLKTLDEREADDEDTLMTEMELLVGEEGLRYLDVLFQLLSIEERFEE